MGRSSVFPTLPNHWCWKQGQTPSWGGEAALGQVPGRGDARALLISFPLLFREVCSNLQLLLRVFQSDEAALWAGGIPEGSGLGFESFIPAGN